MFLLAPLVTLVALVSFSQGYVWESEKPLRNYNIRYQKRPPKLTTAMKLAKYFLVQGEAMHWEPEEKPAARLKRQAGRVVGAKRQLYPYDVLFIIDSSASIRERDFVQGMNALIGLIPRARPDTIYASITFSTTAEIDFLFTSADKAVKKLGEVQYIPGKTNTQAALEMARLQVFNHTAKSGLRLGSYKRALILTDGQSNVKKEKTLYNAFRLKDLGVEMFVVAVGKYMKGISEIVGLASSTDAHLYRVTNLKDFVEVVKLIPNWRELRMHKHRTWLHHMSLQDHEYYGQ